MVAGPGPEGLGILRFSFTILEYLGGRLLSLPSPNLPPSQAHVLGNVLKEVDVALNVMNICPFDSFYISKLASQRESQVIIVILEEITNQVFDIYLGGEEVFLILTLAIINLALAVVAILGIVVIIPRIPVIIVSSRVEAGIVHRQVKPLGADVNHLVPRGTEFLALAVVRNAHNVGGVNLNNQENRIPTTETLSILKSTSVETVGTATVGIIVHIVAVDLNSLANAVDDATTTIILALEQLDIARGDRMEIGTNSLVSKEVTIGGNGQFVTLKEAIEFLNATAGRVLLQLRQESNQRHRIEVGIRKLKDAVNAERMNSGATEEDSTILNLDVFKLVEVLLDSLLWIHITKHGVPVFVAVSLNGLTKHRILATHNVASVVGDDRERTTVFV
jgi:hypothetical protein